MDYKKSKAPTNTITHNLMDFAEPTGNIYESLVIMGKRANQISAQMKEDLSRKLKEFASGTDTLEETFENLPKSTLIAAEDFLHGKVYFRNPLKERDQQLNND